MKRVLVVYAHPEPRSLNGALLRSACNALAGAGHTVEVSDLYAMRWKAVGDADDFPTRDRAERLRYGTDSRAAFDAGTIAPDIAAEHAKLRAADAVVFQFPLWWFGLPAILKGWVDRVLCGGFGYGILQPGARYATRYGEGVLAGKRALVAITAGGQPAHFSARGVNGALADLLFPFTHGTLYYTGMAVLEPFAVFGANRLADDAFPALADRYRTRLAGLFTDAPIAFRAQNGGDYDDDLLLRPGLEGAARGLAMHRRS